jgi:hypothetical protein
MWLGKRKPAVVTASIADGYASPVLIDLIVRKTAALRQMRRI